jgi:acyl-CoA thioesterase
MGAIVPAVRSMLDTDSSLARFGFEVISAEDGLATVTATPTDADANGHRIVHGGLVYALADTAFACAANSVLAGSVTAEASILYVAPAHVGEVLVAEASVRLIEGRTSLVDVTVRGGERVVAEYRGRGVVLRPRS